MTTVLMIGLAVLLVGSGLAHFLIPGYFRSLVPRWVPAPAAVVVVSGVADLVVGVLLAVPGTRVAAAWATAALVTVYLPAHLDPVARARTAVRSFDRPAAVGLRIAVNLGYIACAVVLALAA